MTPNLLEGEAGVSIALAAFMPSAGEELHIMSPGGLAMDGVQEVDERPGNPGKLFPNHPPLVVMEPQKVRTILARTDADGRMLCNPSSPNRGVYACRYIKKPAKAVPDEGEEHGPQLSHAKAA